jgi:hypothetical protein
MPPALPTAYPADLEAPCAPLPAWTGTTSDDAVQYILELTGLYYDCSDRHAGLVSSINK